MSDLRDHLFETLESLKDPEKPLDVERAKAICQVSGVIIESAKAETRYAQIVGAQPSSEFFDSQPKQPALPAPRTNGTNGTYGANGSAPKLPPGQSGGQANKERPVDAKAQQRVDRQVDDLRRGLELDIEKLADALVEEGMDSKWARKRAANIVADFPDADFDFRLTKALETATAPESAAANGGGR
jgi:hypothetical protein